MGWEEAEGGTKMSPRERERGREREREREFAMQLNASVRTIAWLLDGRGVLGPAPERPVEK